MYKIRSFLTTLALALSVCLPMAAQDDDWRPYLTREQLPDGSVYLPAPPDTAGMLFFNDWYRYRWGKSLRDTPRGEQAAREAACRPDDLARFFSEAFGQELSRQGTPAIFEVLSRTVHSAAEGNSKAKKHYMRMRPYVRFGEGTLVPEEEESHRKSGSFPSSHAAMGWAAALVLAEINPGRQDGILQYGFEYGQSRVIAGYHYQSDVDAARLSAAACVARLHADPAFRKDMARARKEMARLAARTSGR